MALEDNLKIFIKYFTEYWIPKFDYWNIHRFSYMLPKLKRTNNCLERYNRRFNSKFPNAHPSICQFVSTLREEESYFSIYVRSIMSGMQTVEEAPCSDFPSSEAFHDWIQARIENYNVSFSSENKNNSKSLDDNIPSDISSTSTLDNEFASNVHIFKSNDSWMDYLDNNDDEMVSNLDAEFNSNIHTFKSDDSCMEYLNNNE
jgi:hypothetical protein